MDEHERDYSAANHRRHARAAGLSRRKLLKKGFLGGAILLVGGSVPVLLRPSRLNYAPRMALRSLTAAEYAVFATAAARICPRDAAGIPATGGHWPTAEALDCAGKVDNVMAGLHPRAAADFRKLLRVFESGMTGLFAIGNPTTFTASSEADQDRRLNAWRRSRVALFRSGYQAIKRLAFATYYSSPETFALVGYPGPPVVPQGPS